MCIRDRYYFLSSRQRPSMHSHALPRGRLRVRFPARAYWTQQSNLTRRYLVHPITEVKQWEFGLYWLGTQSTVVYGPSWCQIHPHGCFCFLHRPRVKSIMAQGSCLGGLCSQGWEDRVGIGVLPVALTAPSIPWRRLWVDPHTYIHMYIHCPKNVSKYSFGPRHWAFPNPIIYHKDPGCNWLCCCLFSSQKDQFWP